jgi:hypothetical protein
MIEEMNKKSSTLMYIDQLEAIKEALEREII